MEQLPNYISWFDYQPQHRFTVPFYNSVTYLSPFPIFMRTSFTIRSRRQWVAFKISTRQIVQQNVILRTKQIAPLLFQKMKQLVAMLEQQIQTTIRLILLCQRIIFPQQITHSAPQKPLTMKTKLVLVERGFTSRINQAVTGQRLS